MDDLKIRTYTQGVVEDGAGILCDGNLMTVDEVISRLNTLEIISVTMERELNFNSLPFQS